MKLSTALRRAARRALNAGNVWWETTWEAGDYWELLDLRLKYGFALADMAAWPAADTCTALLLLAEIAEGEGR